MGADLDRRQHSARVDAADDGDLAAFNLSFGFIYPVSAMPIVLQLISKIIPLTYFLIVVRGIILKGVGFDVVLPQMVALALFATVLIGLASMRFKKRLE